MPQAFYAPALPTESIVAHFSPGSNGDDVEQVLPLSVSRALQQQEKARSRGRVWATRHSAAMTVSIALQTEHQQSCQPRTWNFWAFLNSSIMSLSPSALMYPHLISRAAREAGFGASQPTASHSHMSHTNFLRPSVPRPKISPRLEH